jgi:hypothetical protein
MEKVRRDPIISSLQMNIGHIRDEPIKEMVGCRVIAESSGEHEQRDAVRWFHLILLRVTGPVDVFQRVEPTNGKRASGRDQPDIHGAASKALADLLWCLWTDLGILDAQAHLSFYPSQSTSSRI